MTTSPVVEVKAGASFLVQRHAAAEVQTPEAFGDELRMMGQSARLFVEREIVPVLERLEKLDYELSREKLRAAGELGLLAIDVPEAYGGIEASKTASLLVAEKLASSGSFNVTFNAHSCIGTLPIVYFGDEEQKSRYLPRLASGEWVSAYCLTESGSGSDARAATTRATLSDDGEAYRLTGSKMWISNAGFADLFIVFAQVDGDRLTAFLLERGTPGLSLGVEERKMGIKGSSTRRVILEEAAVPRGNVLGEVGKGDKIAFSILNLGRLKLAAGAIGGVKEMIGLVAGYAQEREQFGQPIGRFGLIREKVGAMAANAFALESSVYRLAGDLDRRSAGLDEGGDSLAALGEYVVEYSLVKVYGSEILDEVIDETLQIFGGNGYSAEYPIELAYRNSRINRIFEGTNEINRLLASGQLIKRALTGREDLLAAGREAVVGAGPPVVSGPERLQATVGAGEGIKRTALLLATAAALGLGDQLEGEQEVLARVADLTALAYLSDSALLRAERMLLEAGAESVEAAEQATLLAEVYAFAAVDRARVLVGEGLSRLPEGEAHRDTVAGYLQEHGRDLIGMRREASEAVYRARGYPLG